MIEFKNVDVVFGDQPQQALGMLDEGLDREAILDRTGHTVAVNNASLRVEKGEICVLMGLSGSGKSSLLRTANGLNDVSRGQVLITTEEGEQDFFALSVEQQRKLRLERITMVFQKFALMPWLTVGENVAFGLEMKGMSRAQVRKRVDEQLELVGLAQWRDTKPGELSGGMQQRVGLARALAMESDIILMDEPFSALDPLIRNQLQDELLRLQEKLNKTVIFVSHDLDEALKLGNHIAIMKDGCIVQHDTPENIVLNPANDYVRSFVSHTNPVNVLLAQSLMRPLTMAEKVADEICVSKRYDYWLKTADKLEESQVRYADAVFPVQRWSTEQDVESLQKLPTIIPADTLMRDVVAIRHFTGHAILVGGEKEISGVINDQNIYHALLGRHLDDN
ncbi:choline ABC transporter ATP-binding protein [Hahella sp. NBU794]|uniref:choline ABC transporter ATP-binding protein n=1 Tax=Hahella sp. NBU794 TaxID=3422590 RepID=UPI003D6FBCC5